MNDSDLSIHSISSFDIALCSANSAICQNNGPVFPDSPTMLTPLQKIMVAPGLVYWKSKYVGSQSHTRFINSNIWGGLVGDYITVGSA